MCFCLVFSGPREGIGSLNLLGHCMLTWVCSPLRTKRWTVPVVWRVRVHHVVGWTQRRGFVLSFRSRPLGPSSAFARTGQSFRSAAALVMPSPHVCSNPTADALKQLRAAIAKSDEENRATLDGAVDAKIKAEEQLQAGGCPACRWAHRWLSCVSLPSPPPPHTHTHLRGVPFQTQHPLLPAVLPGSFVSFLLCVCCRWCC